MNLLHGMRIKFVSTHTKDRVFEGRVRQCVGDRVLVEDERKPERWPPTYIALYRCIPR